MRRYLLVAGVFLLAGFACLFIAHANATTKNSTQDQPPDEYKITPEDIARKNPVAPSPEGMAEARKMYKYDCAMCHGGRGDGKGELVESMKLTMKDWHDPAALTGMTDGEMFYIITKGKGKMPPEGDRQAEKVRWNLVNLVRSFAKNAATQAAAPKS
jgi:mono/diheme cytochrome c family protein